jgi:hypothetical protein
MPLCVTWKLTFTHKRDYWTQRYGLGIVEVSFKMRKRSETGKETSTIPPRHFWYPLCPVRTWDIVTRRKGGRT